MYAYQVFPGTGIAGLERVKRNPTPLGPGQVRVRVHAVALNYRDLMAVDGSYGLPADRAIVPCSDGAGEVIETGAGVTRFKIGDRVASVFFPDWIEGEPTPAKGKASLGGSVDGVLAEQVVLHEQALVRIPDHLDFAQAATLTCAGVTAWNALFVAGQTRPGDTVLVLGTGGVSIWALQLARATGVNAIVTSSRDDKLERARALGATATINYRSTPEWQNEVMRLTQGKGADTVLEVGGQGTLTRSIAAARMGGCIAIIGGVSGGFSSQLDLISLVGGAKRMAGIFVGNRQMHEQLTQCVESAAIVPVVDRVFPFEKAQEAYAWLQSGAHFGKVVVQVGT